MAILIDYVSTGTGGDRDWSGDVNGLQLLGPGGLHSAETATLALAFKHPVRGVHEHRMIKRNILCPISSSRVKQEILVIVDECTMFDPASPGQSVAPIQTNREACDESVIQRSERYWRSVLQPMQLRWRSSRNPYWSGSFHKFSSREPGRKRHHSRHINQG